MKISARLVMGLLATSLTFGMMGCKGQPPEPPVEVGAPMTVSNGVTIKVKSFEVARPDYLDVSGKAVQPAEENAEVAVLKLEITNPSSSEVTYRPLHFNEAKSRVQVCTNPNEITGNRTNIRAIKFDKESFYHTTNQIVDSNYKIGAGQTIVDEYLFEVPTVTDDLVVLIPDEIVGGTQQKVLRAKLGTLTDGAPKLAAQPIGKPYEIDGMSMTISSVAMEYAELVPKNQPAKPLVYPYAYTQDPVIAVRVSIRNNGKTDRAYDPSHNAGTAGVSFKFANSPQKRIKFDSAYGKGQVTSKISIAPGDAIQDVYFFEAPGSSGSCTFEVDGYTLSVPGLYRFAFNFEHTTPAKPDLEPYKNAGVVAAEGEEVEGEENAEEAEDAEGAEETAESEEAAAE